MLGSQRRSWGWWGRLTTELSPLTSALVLASVFSFPQSNNIRSHCRESSPMDREVLLQHSKCRNDGLFQCGQHSVWLLATPSKRRQEQLKWILLLTWVWKHLSKILQVYLWRCLCRGLFSEDKRPTRNVGSTFLWAEVPDWIKRQPTEHQSSPLSASWLQLQCVQWPKLLHYDFSANMGSSWQPWA